MRTFWTNSILFTHTAGLALPFYMGKLVLHLIFHIVMTIADYSGNLPPAIGFLPNMNEFVCSALLLRLSFVGMIEPVNAYFNGAVIFNRINLQAAFDKFPPDMRS